MYDIRQLRQLVMPILREIAESMGIEDAKSLNKDPLIYKILDRQAVLSSDELKRAEILGKSLIDARSNQQTKGKQDREETNALRKNEPNAWPAEGAIRAEGTSDQLAATIAKYAERSTIQSRIYGDGRTAPARAESPAHPPSGSGQSKS